MKKGRIMKAMIVDSPDGFGFEEAIFDDKNFCCYAYTGDLLPIAGTVLEFDKFLAEQEFSKIFMGADKAGKEFLNKLKPADISFIKGILSISGVVKIVLVPNYSFLVKKGDAFTWPAIESQLIKVVKRLYWKKAKIEEVEVVEFKRIPEPYFWPGDKNE